MKRTVLVLGFLVLMAGVGIGIGLSGDQDSDTTTESASDNDTGSLLDTEDESEPEHPDPEISWSQHCDYLLGDFTPTERGFRFVADAKLRNTGNVAVKALVVASWDLIGGERIVEEKTVKVPLGARRRVGFVHVATGDQIDQHQSLGFGRNCRVRVRLVKVVGEPQDV